jgi:D-sedoheptulose 7-phosphate isomerase
LSALDNIKNYISDVEIILEKLPLNDIIRVVDRLKEAQIKGRKVFIFGNGGSSATASHFACDLSKGAISKGKPRIKAFALTDNTPLLTAWANDSSYENVFAEQLENYIEPGDIAIGISGSGNSANILKGVLAARAHGATSIGIIGFGGGKLKDLVDIAVIVPSFNMERVEDVHLLLEHVITACLREEL